MQLIRITAQACKYQVNKLMNPPENQNWQRRLQELEKEINQSTFRQTENSTENPHPTSKPKDWEQVSGNTTQILQIRLNQIKTWFNNLPRGGQLAVGALGVIVGFSVVNTVLKLVASLVSIAVLAGLIYLFYKFFIAPQSPE